mgnify:CR=1 FL=1
MSAATLWWIVATVLAGAELLTGTLYLLANLPLLLLALVATVYGCWLVYAAGVEYLLLVALLYSPGIFIYWKARQHHGLRSLNRLERGMTAALLGCAVLAFYKVMDGTIPLH